MPRTHGIKHIDHPVGVIVNCDGVQRDEGVAADHAEMVSDLERRFHVTLTRYSGSAFLRLKLGEFERAHAPI